MVTALFEAGANPEVCGGCSKKPLNYAVNAAFMETALDAVAYPAVNGWRAFPDAEATVQLSYPAFAEICTCKRLVLASGQLASTNLLDNNASHAKLLRAILTHTPHCLTEESRSP